MFVTYDVSIELIRELRPVVGALRKYDRDLAGQLHRAANSIALNIAEGRDRCDGDQRRAYEMANGSAAEVHAALDVTEAWGWPVAVGPSRAVLHRLRGLLYGLTRGRRAASGERNATSRLPA